jgi:hypothetical protein
LLENKHRDVRDVSRLEAGLSADELLAGRAGSCLQ